MKQNKNYVAFVGPRDVWEVLGQIDETWDMQFPIESLGEFDRALAEDEIHPNTSLVIIFSWLFNDDPLLFADLVSYMSPYAVTCVLIPEAEMELNGRKITDAVRSSQRQKLAEDEEYNANIPFFYVRYENPQEDIFGSIQRFTQSTFVDPKTLEIVKGLLPELELEEDDSVYAFDEEYEEPIEIEEPEEGDGKVIAVTSSKGGTGKSTVAMLLGAYASMSSELSQNQGLEPKNLKVCMVDLDTRDGQLGFLNREIGNSIINIYVEGQPTIENVQKSVFKNRKTGVDFIFAPKVPRSATLIPAYYYVDLIKTLRKMYDLIILDTSVNYMDPLLEEVAYPMADHILFISDFYVPSILGMSRWITEVCHNKENPNKAIPKSKVSICLNKVLKDVNMGHDKIEQAAQGIPVISVLPSAASLITYAGNSGSLEQVLNHRVFNERVRGILQEVYPGYEFAKLPTM